MKREDFDYDTIEITEPGQPPKRAKLSRPNEDIWDRIAAADAWAGIVEDTERWAQIQAACERRADEWRTRHTFGSQKHKSRR